jgi:hypothetical protein
MKLALSVKKFGANKKNTAMIKEEMYKKITNECFKNGLATGV